MSIIVTQPDDTNNNYNVIISETNPDQVVITINDTPKEPILVQENTFRGPEGKSPDISVYKQQSITSVNGVLDIDASLATTFFVSLHENVTSINIINWPPATFSQRITLYFQQDSIGSRIVTGYPVGTKWSFGQQPSISVLPHKIDCMVFDTFDSGAVIFGNLVGLAYS